MVFDASMHWVLCYDFCFCVLIPSFQMAWNCLPSHGADPKLQFLVLDFSAVSIIDGPSIHFLKSLVEEHRKRGIQVLVVQPNKEVVAALRTRTLCNGSVQLPPDIFFSNVGILQCRMLSPPPLFSFFLTFFLKPRVECTRKGRCARCAPSWTN